MFLYDFYHAFSWNVLVMFWGCFRDVLGMFQGCFGDVSGMFWGCFRDVLGMIQNQSGNVHDEHSPWGGCGGA